MHKSGSKSNAGFTLLEMILATAIFAILGMATYSFLDGVIQTDDASKQKMLTLRQLQFSFQLMENDFQQASLRHVRVDGQAPIARVMTGQEFMIDSEADAVAFVRDGWRNPKLLLPRSELQSVAYRLSEGNLERMFFIFIDPVTGKEPKSQVLLTGVESLTIEYFDQGLWQEAWSKSGLPRAVKVTIKTANFGEVQRIFLMPDQAGIT